jgi:hypothetical protein
MEEEQEKCAFSSFSKRPIAFCSFDGEGRRGKAVCA